MERASEVFYDLVLNHQPELLSPQIDQYFEATKQEKLPVQLEKNNELSLGNLSEILVGLSEQALSFRRDAVDRDYPNEFYEKLLMPEEFRPTESTNMSEAEKHELKEKHNMVLMERSYLNSWTNFISKAQQLINSHFPEMIKQAQSAEELLRGLRALVDCRLEALPMRNQICDKLHGAFRQADKVDTNALIDGIYGLGGVWKQPG